MSRATAQTLPQLLSTRDRPRLAAYRTHLAFYNGTQWPARLRRAQPLTINYTRAIVKKVTSFVMTGFQVSIAPLDNDAGDAARLAEAALADIAGANALPRLDFNTEIDAAVLGDACYKLAWDPADNHVNITAPDMAGVFPWPHPSDPNTFYRVAHRYQLPAADIAATWGLKARAELAWVIEDWTDDRLDIYVDDGPAPALSGVNPYSLIPFVIYPNEGVPKQWNGASDVLDLTTIQQEINAEYTRSANIMELSGFPIAVLSGVEQSQGIQAQAGAIWELPEQARADVLDLLKNGALDQHLSYLQTLKNTMHDLAEAPRAAFGDNQRSLSGVALEVELLPLLHKVARKRTIRTDAYTRRATIALALTDLFTGTNHSAAGKVLVNWSPPSPRDRSRDIINETQLTAAQLSSHRSAIARLGDDDPDDELDTIIKENARLAPPAKEAAPAAPTV